MKYFLIFAILLNFSTKSYSKKEAVMDQLELQENIQRFYTRFTERTLEGLLNSKKGIEKHRESFMQEYLLYDSEALKISTGPFPEVNLLDMLVFVKLNKIVIREHWIPKIWKKEGIPVLKAFYDSERDIESIALKILEANQLKEIDEIVKNWREVHPHQFRVEKIRLGDFSVIASKSLEQRQEKGKGFSLSNMLVDTRDATQAVDQMVLVANRAIFLSQYMPNILRIHARLGTQEIIGDILARMARSEGTLEGMEKVKPMLTTLSTLTRDLDLLAKDTGRLMKTFRTEFPEGMNATVNLKEIHHIVEKSNSLMKELKTLQNEDFDFSRSFKKIFRDIGLYIALLLTMVGFAISVFWWTGSYLVRRRFEKKENGLSRQ